MPLPLLMYFKYQKKVVPGHHVIKTEVDHSSRCGKYGAVLVSISAHGHHDVDIHVCELVDVLRALLCDVHARLGHHFDGVGV